MLFESLSLFFPGGTKRWTWNVLQGNGFSDVECIDEVARLFVKQMTFQGASTERLACFVESMMLWAPSLFYIFPSCWIYIVVPVSWNELLCFLWSTIIFPISHRSQLRTHNAAGPPLEQEVPAVCSSWGRTWSRSQSLTCCSTSWRTRSPSRTPIEKPHCGGLHYPCHCIPVELYKWRGNSIQMCSCSVYPSRFFCEYANTTHKRHKRLIIVVTFKRNWGLWSQPSFQQFFW